MFIKIQNLSICLIVFLSCIKILPQGQNLRFEHITIEDGLSQGYVTSIIQDKYGFLWFGTQDGLDKYNGYGFTYYKYDENDSTSLSDNWVTAIVEDSIGNIWVGTAGHGLYKISSDRVNNKRYPIGTTDGSNSVYIGKLAVDNTNILWIGTWGNGIYLFNPTTESLEQIQNEPGNENSLSNNRISSMIEDSKGYFWIGTHEGGLNRYDKETKSFKRYLNEPDNESSISFNWVSALCEDSDGNIWVGTYGNGLNKMDRFRDKFTRYTIENAERHGFRDSLVSVIYEDTEGTLWIGSDGGGLYRYNKVKDSFDNFREDPTNLHGLNDNRIWSVCEDRSGILWFGGFSGGVNKFDKSKNQFIYYGSNPYETNSLKNNFVKAVLIDDDNKLWVGTNGGITIIDREKNKYKHLQHDKNNPNSLSNNYIRAIIQDDTGNYWIGTWGAGLNRYNRKTGRITRFINKPNNPNSIVENFIRRLYYDGKGNLWIATTLGLSKLNLGKMQFTNYQHDPDDPNTLSDNRLYTLMEDSKGNLWIGSAAGLNKFNPTNQQFTVYLHDPDNPASISDSRIRSLYEDQSGIIWVGTYGGGINKFDPNTESFTSYTDRDGLPNNVVYEILEDDRLNLWFSTNKGLCKFNPRKLTFKTYQVQDGLQSNEFNGGAAFRSKLGEMFFGGVNGLNSFFPDNIHDNPHIPPIAITEFRVLNNLVEPSKNNPILKKSINDIDRIDLQYDQNVFSFEFAALEFTAPTKNEYKYYLEGFHESWQNAGTRRYVNYTNLDPGEYIFHVKGSNNDGVWNEEGISLAITIHPPFWATWWFRLLASVVVIGSIALWIFVRIRRIQKQKEILEHKVSIRTKELREAKSKTEEALQQSEAALTEAEKARKIAEEATEFKSRLLGVAAHDLKNPLNTILGYTRMISSSDIDKNRAAEYLTTIETSSEQMLELINKLQNLSAIETGKMEINKMKTKLSDVVESTVDELTPLALAKKQEIKFGEEEPGLFVNADKNKMKEIVANLLSNAIKFSESNKTILVKIKLISNNAVVEVIDEGPGLTEDDKKKVFGKFQKLSAKPTANEKATGLGLAISKQLAELQNGSLTVESKYGAGATFRFSLPNLDVDPGEYLADLEAENSDGDKESASDSKPTILIADDEQSNRNLIIDMLGNDDYVIYEATDGDELINKSAEVKPDTIISDLVMPGMKVANVLDMMKNDDTLKHIPVIIVTGYSAENLENVEYDEVIYKPILRQVLKEKVNNCIKKNSKKSASKNLSLFIKELKADYLPEWEKISKTMVIDEIEDFAGRLANLANSYSNDSFAKYAGELKSECENFDIQKITYQLKNFPKLIKQIK